MPPNLRAAGEMLISHIDDDGYFRTPMEEVLKEVKNHRHSMI